MYILKNILFNLQNYFTSEKISFFLAYRSPPSKTYFFSLHFTHLKRESVMYALDEIVDMRYI